MKVMQNGGSINADLQCSVVHSMGWIGNNVIAVMNSCKDFRPSGNWVCVCLPGLRYFHVDARHFGIPTRIRTPKDLRKHMASILGSGGFVDIEKLWDYARENDLPRIIHADACARGGIPVTEDDRTVTAGVIASAAHAPCRAVA